MDQQTEQELEFGQELGPLGPPTRCKHEHRLKGSCFECAQGKKSARYSIAGSKWKGFKRGVNWEVECNEMQKRLARIEGQSKKWDERAEEWKKRTEKWKEPTHLHLGQKKNLDELGREKQQMKEVNEKEREEAGEQLKQLQDDDVYCLNRQEKWNQENQRMRSRVAEDSRWVKHAEWKDLLEKWIKCRFEWYGQLETRGSHYQEYRRTLAAVMHGSER